MATEGQPARRVPNVVMLAIIGVALLALVAVVVTRGGSSSSSSSPPASGSSSNVETRPVAVAGTPLPRFDSSGGADAAIGARAPVLTGETFDGAKITIGDTGPAVIVFVAHWCPHCRREVPFLTSYLHAHGNPKGVTLDAVATSVDPTAPNYPPSKWLRDAGWTVPTLVDDAHNGAADAFGLSAFPYFVALDRSGKVVARSSGELEAPALETLFAAARNG